MHIQETAISKDLTFDEVADWHAPVKLCSGDSDLRSESMEVVVYLHEKEDKMTVSWRVKPIKVLEWNISTMQDCMQSHRAIKILLLCLDS